MTARQIPLIMKTRELSWQQHQRLVKVMRSFLWQPVILKPVLVQGEEETCENSQISPVPVLQKEVK